MSIEHFSQLLPVYATYLVATASPGPSNMAIMGVAMSQGRAPALALALGVVTGSMFWAILAATGISAVLGTYAEALFAIKIAGGLYLLYLAYKSAKSALSASVLQSRAAHTTSAKSVLYCRGVLFHLTNPKAVLAWIAIMSLGLRPDSPPYSFQAIVAGCAILGVIVFGGYALIFSMAPMVSAYQNARRWIEGALSVFFAFAGVRLLLSKT
jgi:threonine efflux protein